jgi:two-component sensor histidine kinase
VSARASLVASAAPLLRRANKFSACAHPRVSVTARPQQEAMMPELVPHLPSEEPLLLDELNHRISNEFASLISLVFHAARASANDEVKRALSGVAQVLHSYAEVHHALRPPEHGRLVDAEGYLSKLCRAISRSKLDHMNIDLVLAAPPLLLESDRCWQLGMILSELITNAARHAFAGGPGTIRVELLHADEIVKCTVRDNGSAAAQVRPGRGLRIIEELTKGLNGRFERKFGPAGTAAVLSFPYGEPEKAGGQREDLGSDDRRNLRTHRATTS